MRLSRPPMLAVFTRLSNHRHAYRFWFETDRTRAIDRYIDYFGGAAPSSDCMGDAYDREAPIVASRTFAPSAP